MLDVQIILVFVSLVKYFDFMRLEIVASCEQALGVACAIFVARQLHIAVTQVAVRICVITCRVSDVNIVSTAECWTIVAVPIYGSFDSFDMKLEWFQSIIVFKREYKAVG